MPLHSCWFLTLICSVTSSQVREHAHSLPSPHRPDLFILNCYQTCFVQDCSCQLSKQALASFQTQIFSKNKAKLIFLVTLTQESSSNSNVILSLCTAALNMVGVEVFIPHRRQFIPITGPWFWSSLQYFVTFRLRFKNEPCFFLKVVLTGALAFCCCQWWFFLNK